MKTKMTVILILICNLSFASAQGRVVKNQAFQRGETLKYKAYYDAILTGQVVAGTCTFQIKDEDKKINNRSTFHVEVLGKTKGAFNWFFKVIDRYESYIDVETLAPWLFIRRVNEGGYIINQDVTFNQAKSLAYFQDYSKNRTANVSTPSYVQDIVSAIYYCRTFDVSNMNNNEEFRVKFLLGDTVYSTKVVLVGKETVNIGIGKIRCLKIKPEVLTGSVFKDPYPVTLWVTDDKNMIPVLAESEILVGKVKMELIEYSGLRNPFTAMIK